MTLTSNIQAGGNLLVRNHAHDVSIASYCAKFDNRIMIVLIKPDPSIILRFGTIDTDTGGMLSVPI